MIGQTSVVPPYQRNKQGLQMMLAAILGISASTRLNMEDPKVVKAYGQVAAIEPGVAYLAQKRGKTIKNEADFEKFLTDIKENKLTARERVGLAKIFDAHQRIGNVLSKGLEGITGDNYRPSIALAMASGNIRAIEEWGNDVNVGERFKELQAIVAHYFDNRREFVN